MLASQTVENYLKAIYVAQGAHEDPQGLVPMGQIAASLGVVPGTATTMVKTLAESGLIRYEPYMGVRLTPAGERLAALVLRRHRLIEQFLVQVLGMNWSEVITIPWPLHSSQRPPFMLKLKRAAVQPRAWLKARFTFHGVVFAGTNRAQTGAPWRAGR